MEKNMKRIILSLVLFAALCALAAGSYIYIAGATARLLNRVELVASEYYEGNYNAALELEEELFGVMYNRLN